MKSCSTTLRPMLRAIFALIATTCLALQPFRSLAADEDGVALAIVYDTSGSMKEPVRTADGKQAAKWIVGNRSLEQIVNRVEHFSTNSTPPKTIHAGLFVFKGTGAAGRRNIFVCKFGGLKLRAGFGVSC